MEIATISAAALAAGAYLNAKLGISTDLNGLAISREFGGRVGKRIQSLGDTVTIYRLFELVNEQNEALWFEGRTWTYGELKNEVINFAAFLSINGVSKGDFIAVFMTNSPEMVITILALSKLSAISALINTNLRDDTLKHCLNVSTAKTILTTPDLAPFVKEPLYHFSLSLFSFPHIPTPTDSSITLLTTLPTPSTIPTTAKATLRDLACLVYTSGTTGKPKACAIRNNHMIIVSVPQSQDVRDPKRYFPLRMYSPLPLFHGTALFAGLWYSIGSSSTFCLARKFSSSRFWQDVPESRATRIMYVGELCRYVLSAPPSPYDRNHQCIVATGNGLRGEIWEKFRERFNVREIREFYRSTEGVAKFDNFGRGLWGAGKLGFAEEIYRDPRTGFCVKAALGEPGEAIGRIKDRELLTEYLGNLSATEDKLLTDVFVKGDIYHRMGDLLCHQTDGWVSFHDRLGDTFRWKGENVSAGEVRDHIARLPGVQDVTVYGVKLASYDGQAGATSITLDTAASEEFMRTLFEGLRKTGLPLYAVPRLVRITKEIESNATFKKAKGDMVKKTWNENAKGNTDKLYWLNGSKYERLDRPAWASIEEGRAKL
ncbi:Solute carrier family 27 member 4 [Hyphodiscus hymeniophilus]|uniref:Solute carrier family 27 member 4 n=1 Tax=Hyphodiscus hymeniophilus TaxID=353542 RepID=A0A9P6VGL3_9HELO|nr:Solute carrier family 27 member 4 [Hyphodiscus hymeniophilus]